MKLCRIKDCEYYPNYSTRITRTRWVFSCADHRPGKFHRQDDDNCTCTLCWIRSNAANPTDES